MKCAKGFGIYTNQVVVFTPKGANTLRQITGANQKLKKAAGKEANAITMPIELFSKMTACLDPCIASEIIYLWRHGITTYGSCCGHGKILPIVVTDKADYNRMVKWGYKIFRRDKCDEFILKSVCIRAKEYGQAKEQFRIYREA